MTPVRRQPAEWCTPELEQRLADDAPRFVAQVLLLAESASSHGAVAAVPAVVLAAAAWCRDRLSRRGPTP